MSARPIAVLLTLLAGIPAGSLRAQEFMGPATNCTGLKLQEASGVPKNSRHTYLFNGTCDLLMVGDNTHLVHRFPAEAVVRWDKKTKELREDFRILGGFSWDGKTIGGRVNSRFICNDDPLVTSAACNGVGHTNETGLEALSGAYQEFRPITKGKTTLAEATAKSGASGQTAGTNAPPPPPPSPKPKRAQPATATPAVATPVAPAAGRVAVTPHDSSPARRAPARIPALPVQPRPAPDVPPGASAFTFSDAKYQLASGYALTTWEVNAEPRWAIIDSTGKPLRTFPEGSAAYRDANNSVFVNWGGGVYAAGKMKVGRLQLPKK